MIVDQNLISRWVWLYRFIGFAIVTVGISGLTHAQIAAFEKHIGTSNDATINLQIESHSLTNTTIRSWDRDEVYIAAVSNGRPFNGDNIKATVGKDKIDIDCHSDDYGSTYLTVFIPSRSTLVIKTDGARMQVKEPQGIIQIDAYPKFTFYAKSNIRLTVPETSTIDLRGADKIIEHDSPARPIAYDQKRITAKGAPYLTFIQAKSNIEIFRSWANNQQSKRPLTAAVQAIARRNTSMSAALRKSEPRLKTVGDDKPAGNKTPDEDAEVKLQTQLVVLNASVTDSDGRAVSSLKQTDFKIFEDEVLQETASFSPEKSPFNLVLLIDLSPSVLKKIDLIREAALHFLDVIGPDDKVAIITFSSDVKVISHLSNDRQDLQTGIKLMQPFRSGTAFYDALGYAVAEELADVRGQRNAIVILSDGEDNSIDLKLRYPTLSFNPGAGSLLTFEQLLDSVLEADILIYSIHLECECETSGLTVTTVPSRVYSGSAGTAAEFVRKLKATARTQMQELSSATGGRYFNATRIDDIKGVYEQVATELQSVYTLTYSPRNQNFDGKFRKIRVVATDPGSTNPVTHTRRGYYAR